MAPTALLNICFITGNFVQAKTIILNFRPPIDSLEKEFALDVHVCVCTLKVHGYIVSFTGLHAVLLGGLGEHQDRHIPAYSFKCQFEIPTPADKEWKGKSKAFQMPLAKTLTPCEMHLFHIL